MIYGFSGQKGIIIFGQNQSKTDTVYGLVASWACCCRLDLRSLKWLCTRQALNIPINCHIFTGITKSGEIRVKTFFFLSACCHAVKGIWLDPYLETVFNDLSLTRLSQGHRKQKYANGCHFCTLLEKAMQISFVSFFLALLIEQVGTRRLMPLGWSINSVGELYTVMHNQKSPLEIQTFHPGLQKGLNMHKNLNLRPIEKLFGDSIHELTLDYKTVLVFPPTVSTQNFQFWFTVMHGNTK